MDDYISRQAALDALERRKDKTAKGEIGSFYNTIIQHDIDAIVELPSAQPECDDTVSRKAEIDAIKRYIRGFDAIDVNFLDGLKTAIQIIEQLPHEYSNAQNTLQRVGSVECEDAVSRQAAMNAFAEYVKRSNNSDFAPTPTWNNAVDIVENLLSVDAVEVVRCKDCKWFNDIGCSIRIVDDSDKPTENDYCSFGERKDG